jgi:hypothetical protein
MYIFWGENAQYEAMTDHSGLYSVIQPLEEVVFEYQRVRDLFWIE